MLFEAQPLNCVNVIELDLLMKYLHFDNFGVLPGLCHPRYKNYLGVRLSEQVH